MRSRAGEIAVRTDMRKLGRRFVGVRASSSVSVSVLSNGRRPRISERRHQ